MLEDSERGNYYHERKVHTLPHLRRENKTENERRYSGEKPHCVLPEVQEGKRGRYKRYGGKSVSELKDKYEEITNRLQKNADEKMNREIRESQAYNQGYKQACEDYFKELKADLFFKKTE